MVQSLGVLIDTIVICTCTAMIMLLAPREITDGLQAYTIVWDLGDVGIGLMTIINLIILVSMSKEAISILDRKSDKAAQIKKTARMHSEQTEPSE